MPKRNREDPKPEIRFDDACSRIEATLSGGTRGEVLAGLSTEKSYTAALTRLRDAMRRHRLSSGKSEIDLGREVLGLDGRTRKDGFHVLQDWDGVADRLNEETIPVDVVSFMIREHGAGEVRRDALAVLLDYYFFYLLALLAMRVWDDGDPNENLDRVSRLLQALQGPEGSGQRFVARAETLFSVATSHFEPDVQAFDRLLERVKTLDGAHRARVALVYAAILSSHLRFGFEATYGRDIVEMRNDNAPDYPWLCFSLATLMDSYEHASGAERERIVEGLLNGLSPDPRAFVGAPPASLSDYEAERSRFAEQFLRHRDHLLEQFERHRPGDTGYSPVAFFFNFPHNLLKAMVVDALVRGTPSALALDDLLTGAPPQPPAEERRALAETLMGYARASPDRIRGRLVPVVVYDPRAGRRSYRETIRRLRE